MPGITAYLASAIIAGDQLELISNAVLNISAGRILSIGEAHPAADRVDLGNVLLMPGFINAHTHLGDTGAKELGAGLPLEQVINPPHGLKHRYIAGLSPEEHIQQMRHGLREMITNGIFACADFREQGLSGVQALYKAADGLPIRVIALGRMAEGLPPQELLIEAQAILEAAEGLGIRDVTSYPVNVLETLREEFPQKLFAIHAAENTQADIQCREFFGVGQAIRALAFSPDILVHLTNTPEAEIEILFHRNIGAVCCPRTNAILGDGIPAVNIWQRYGLRFGIGTDNLMLSSPDMFREMDALSRMLNASAKMPAVLEPRKILAAATIEGARLIKLDHDLGSLLPGKEASFLVLDLNSPNLKYSHDLISSVVHRASPADIRQIFIKGVQVQ